jgi:hypothetical protein
LQALSVCNIRDFFPARKPGGKELGSADGETLEMLENAGEMNEDGNEGNEGSVC